MINNIELIKPLLDFSDPDKFYFLQVLQRKKDHNNKSVTGTNNNSRLIKAYFVHSMEYFENIEKEVVQLCEVFQARAGIDLNRRSYERIAFNCLKKVTDQICNKEFDKVYKSYSSVCGKQMHESNKRWILDIDEKPFMQTGELKGILKKIAPAGDKIVAILPTLNGIHVITKPFNVKEWGEHQKFTDLVSKIDIHKRNPTNLYIPSGIQPKTEFSL